MSEGRDVRGLLEGLIARAAGYEAQASYGGKRGLATRFAENAITQNMGGEEELLRLTLARDGKKGSASTNRLDDEALASLVDRAKAISAAAAPDPEYLPPPPAQDYPAVPAADFADTAALGPADLAERIAPICSGAAAIGYRASGLIEAERTRQAIANSAGLFADEWRTQLRFGATVHGPRGSGRSEAIGESAGRVDTRAAGERALANAARAQDPRRIEPGRYDVIFEPGAVWDFLSYLLLNLDAREAAEGVSALSGSVGTQLFDERVDLSLETNDPDAPAPAYGNAGLPLRRTQWVRGGVLRRLSHGRYWARKQGTEPDAGLFPFCMAGEDRGVDDLVAGCERGLLVKRLWYIRYVDRRELLLTGMTRDGLFLVENGRISHPVMNLRFNDSPLRFLREIVAMGRPERVAGWGAAKLPPIASRGFTFSSVSESL